jgi:hypothetical protein
LDAARDLHDQVLHGDSPVQGQGRARGVRLQGKFRRALEIFHDPAVADLGVLVDQVEVNQLHPGDVELLVGRQKGHQRAQVEAAVDGQIAAHQNQHERPQALEEIVGDLDGVLVKVPDHPHL